MIAIGNSARAQRALLADFLEQKQTWNEKLVVVYDPEEQQDVLKQQLDALHPHIQTLRKENIVVVQIPARLSKADRTYLETKLHHQPGRFQVWVLDEHGRLRMSGTKPAEASQLLRVLSRQQRPGALARAQLFR
ncbi:DUF4174 domain-containing protein [Telluribacter sp.]|jgi:hypothetical protein|uniref:DUF4174 domain-containing protein n=1 Tax=Telluribacter sp. TaxID=1978767 RepID=UPI002E107D1C|nr:DUF4174 domain-containing protein [Telluribacter sp.]